MNDSRRRQTSNLQNPILSWRRKDNHIPSFEMELEFVHWFYTNMVHSVRDWEYRNGILEIGAL